MDLSIVLVNWNGKGLVEQCLRTVEASGTRCDYEIIVSDNASTDGSQEWLGQLERDNPRIHCVFNPDNAGFGVGNNRALPYCRGRYVLFLNTDTLVLESLDALVAEADRLRPRCGALGGRVLNTDKSIQLTCRERYTLPVMIAGLTLAFAGVRPGWVRRQELESWDHRSPRDVAMVSGCYMLVPRRVLDEVGTFDPSIFLFFEEADLCYRIRAAGYVVRYVPVSTIVHLEGESSRSAGLSERVLGQSAWSARYFARKHLGRGRARIATQDTEDVVTIPRQHILFGAIARSPGAADVAQPRFFRRGVLSWPSEVHRQPDLTNLRSYALPFESLDLALLHDVLRTFPQVLDKIQRYAPKDADNYQAAGLPFSIDRLVFRTLDQFLGAMFEGRAYEDGMPGLIYVMYLTVYMFAVQVELWEREGRPSNADPRIRKWGRRVAWLGKLLYRSLRIVKARRTPS